MTSVPRDIPVAGDAPATSAVPAVPSVAVVSAVPEAGGGETDVLARRVETYLSVARTALRGPDLELVERLAVTLRHLVADTTAASAADRARVRAAVHALVLRREAHGRVLPRRSLAAAQQVINQVVRQLGRPDLAVHTTSDGVVAGPHPVDSPCAVC